MNSLYYSEWISVFGLEKADVFKSHYKCQSKNIVVPDTCTKMFTKTGNTVGNIICHYRQKQIKVDAIKVN